ncbi:hypothetical protein [Streptomyces griseofuscus]|uniref:Uncharacterized protein n=1 Tax=Streptomyces griseofuscus TaxID=146922 RepID=A0A3R8WP01_9ACTN|nr:hypothetical protein [Streptomyces griseofuscus]RRQ81562.1 hypothetical protein CQW44_30650 [Streptomyces griseofuscus]
MATLNAQVVSLTGLSPNYASAASGGDKIAPGERAFAHIKNGGGSPVTVTLTTTAAVRGQTVSNVTVSVPASGERMIGPLTADLFGGTTDGLVALGYSSNTSVTIAALRI